MYVMCGYRIHEYIHTTNAYQSFQSLSNQYIISQNVKLSHFLYQLGDTKNKHVQNFYISLTIYNQEERNAVILLSKNCDLAVFRYSQYFNIVFC